jgi:RHS repeat-associated protein
VEVKKIVTGLGNWLNFSGPSRERPRQGESYPDKIISLANYFPFGIDQPGGSWNAGSKYRYGFNGKEKDSNGEWGSTSYDYGFRIYNPGIGKFQSVDPLTKSYPMLTPYQFASNTPIQSVDLDGLGY